MPKLTHRPRVTVLMPVYNGAKYLREAVESVLRQTLTDFEFLIVDDASIDESPAIIASYTDPRIRVLRNERNVGQAASLNRGLLEARGEYVARLDQDDVCLSDRLRHQVDLLDRRHDVAVVCSWEYSIDARGRIVREWRSSVPDYGALLGTLLVGKCPVWHPSVMFRRRVVVDLGGYDASFAPTEDYELWIRLAMRRHGAAIVPRVLLLQRVHGDRQSVRREALQVENTRRAHEQLVTAFASPGDAAALLAMLLRRDDRFWSVCGSPQRLGEALETLEASLIAVRSQRALTAAENESLRRVIYGRLGPGVRVGRRLIHLPKLAFCLLFFGLSPMLIPGVRRAASVLNCTARELRYPVPFLHRILGHG